MSTRATLIYDTEKGLHIYQELLDDTVHIEVEKAGMLVDVEIMSFPEWVSLGLPKQSIDMAKRRLTMCAADLPCCCAEIFTAGVVNPDCPQHGSMKPASRQ